MNAVKISWVITRITNIYSCLCLFLLFYNEMNPVVTNKIKLIGMFASILNNRYVNSGGFNQGTSLVLAILSSGRPPI